MRECFDALERLTADMTYSGIFSEIASHGDLIYSEHIDSDDNIIQESFADFAREVNSAAGVLARLIKKRGFVGIKLENSPDWPKIFWAVLRSGNNPLLIDVKSNITAHLLTEAGATVLITTADETYPGVKTINASLILGKKAKNPDVPMGDMTALCTSGTTGTSRVFVYDGLAMANQLINAKFMIQNNDDIMYDSSDGPLKSLVFLPLHHIFGFVGAYLWYTFFGKTMVFLADKNPATILETCRKCKVTHILCVPLFWNNVASGIMRKVKQGGEKQEKLFARMSALSLTMQMHMKKAGRRLVSNSIFREVQSNLVGGAIRALISGGGHILPETLKIINSIGYPLYNGFGMTETGITSVETSADIASRLDGAVGRPIDLVDYRVEDGELFISGTSLHSGRLMGGKYFPRSEPWFATGDFCRIEDGRLFIDGRIKDVIINDSGENIYPDELEDYFVDLPDVARLCALGINTDGTYPEIYLVLELSGEANSQSISQIAQIIREINGAMPMYKKIRRVLIADDELPVANGIKVQRQRLKAMIEDGSFAANELDLAIGRASGKMSSPAFSDDKRFRELKDEVRSVFARQLLLNEQEIGDFDHFIFDLGGDSLAIIGIIALLEEKYNIFIPEEMLTSAVNVSQTAELLYLQLYQIEEEGTK